MKYKKESVLLNKSRYYSDKILRYGKLGIIYIGSNHYFFFIIPLIGVALFLTISLYQNNTVISKKEVLQQIISVSSISSAIIITYLFSKLFSERNLRVEYKKKVDELSIRINFFRILMYRLITEDSLWKVGQSSIRSVLNNKLNWLTFEIYRGDDKNNTLTYEEHETITTQINGWMGQAYLAMKGFSDGDDSFLKYNDTNNRNYSLNDVIRYDEYQSYIWSYLDEYSSNTAIFNAHEIHSMWFDRMDQYYRKITNTKLKRGKFKEQIKDLMTYFHENIFQKHYYFNTFLSKKFPVSFLRLFTNILVNAVTLIASLLFLLLEVPMETFLSNLLISIFITNMIDLIVILFKAIPQELKVEERYSI